MQGQRVRRTILILSAILFPATFYYLSPAVILMGASEGIVTGSFVFFGLLFLGALVFGRTFCGWLCPGGAIGEAMCHMRNRRITRRWVSWIKYAIWIPWLGLIVTLAVRAGGLTRVDFIYQTWHGISVSSWQALMMFSIVAALIADVSGLIGRRGSCHTACWMAPFMILGRTVRDRFRLPGLRLKANAGACILCGACIRGCPMSLDVQSMMAKESMTATECILCAQCADTCPMQVIALQFSRNA